MQQPDRPDETERVEAAGGRIINWNGSRVCGLLATSRSIGIYSNNSYFLLHTSHRLVIFMLYLNNNLNKIMSALALGPQSFAFYQKALTWMDYINHTYIHLYNVR